MLAVECSGDIDVLQGGLTVHVEPCGDLGDSFRSECPLGINVARFPFGSALVERELSDYAHGVTDLCLSAAKLAKDLADAGAGEASA